LFLGADKWQLVFGRPGQSVLLLGPPRGGKTTSIVVPQILAALAPVVTTSTKRDVFAATAMARACLGRVWLVEGRLS
jgi:type IV secretion system protein VirD4